MALKLGKCRLCLKLGDFYSIFAEDNATQLAEMVMDCARIKIREGDGLPDKICSECIQKLSGAYIFKQQCERSDQELRRNYVPPPGFKESPPPPNRQSSDSAFSNHTDISNQTKPSSSTDGYVTPASRGRKRSRESIETTKSSGRPASKRLSELKSAEKRARLISETTSQPESDYDDDYTPSQYSVESDSDEPIVKTSCKICPRRFPNIHSLNAHMKTHKYTNNVSQNTSLKEASPKPLGDALDSENKLKCEKCEKTFKLQIMLKRHLEVCGKSPQKSPQKELLVSLEPIDSKAENIIECEYCSAKFKTVDNLKKHLKFVHAAVLKSEIKGHSHNKSDTPIRSSLGKVVIPCIYCQKEFGDYFVYNSHFNTCPKKDESMPFACPLCDKVMGKKNGFVAHVKRVHFDTIPSFEKGKQPTEWSNTSVESPSKQPEEVSTPGPTFNCRMCSKTLPNEQALIAHLKGHLSNVEDDDESRPSTIDDTVSVHSEYGGGSSGPLACNICDKRFKYKKALQTHQLKHADDAVKAEPQELEPVDRPPDEAPPDDAPPDDYDDDVSSGGESEDNTCDICEKEFSYRRLLLHHKRTKHNMSSGTKRAKVNLKECSVRCLICDEEMKVGEVNAHNAAHISAGVRPRNLYTCAQCGERAKSCSALAAHIKLVHRLKRAPPSQTAPPPLAANLADFCEVVVTKAEPLDEVQTHNGSPEVPAAEDGGFPCPICAKKMKTIKSLKHHINWHNIIGNNIQKKIECFVCKETFRFQCHFRTHMRAHYADTALDPALLTCGVCGRRSKHLRAALAHNNYHKQTRFQNKDYQCSICKRVFDARKVYLAHMAVHYKRGDTVNNTVVGSGDSGAGGDGAHACHMCGQQCASETALRHHVAWHSSKTSLFGARHDCPLCGLQFTNKRRAELHLRTHYEDDAGPYRCPLCDKGYTDEGYLRRHIKGHNFDHQSHVKRRERLARMRKDKLQCPACARLYPDAVKLMRHMRLVHPESKLVKRDPDAPTPQPLPCKLCAKTFADETRLRRHEEAHLRKPEFYCCKFCGIKNISLRNHNVHIKGHLTKKYLSEPLRCAACAATFTRGYDLHHHLRDVHGITETWATQEAPAQTGPLRPLQCRQCRKVLASQGNFERHLDYHNALRCNYCGEAFSARRFLRGHERHACRARRRLGNTEPYARRVKCPRCYKPFHLALKLLCHLRTQHGERPAPPKAGPRQRFVCDFCFRDFSRADDLAGHKLYHRSNAYYGCIYCPRKFNNLTTFRKHKNHHFAQLNVDNPTRCEHCPETFVAFREMIYHLRDVHNDTKEWLIMPKKVIEEECHLCGKTFYNLPRHLRHHEENRCKKCGEYFLSRADFDKHVCPIASDDETAAPGVAAPAYEECRFCFKPLSRVSSRLKHDLIHRASGAISCRFCPLKFKTMDAFNIHAFSHRSRKYDRKPLRCRECGDQFVRYGPFIRHMRQVHKSKKKLHYRSIVKAEPCAVCGDSFPNLHNHYRAHLQHQCGSCRAYFTSARVEAAHRCQQPDLDPAKVFRSDVDLHALIAAYVPRDANDHEKFYGYDDDSAPPPAPAQPPAPVISDILSLSEIKQDDSSQDSQSAPGDVASPADGDVASPADGTVASPEDGTVASPEDDDVVQLSDDDVGVVSAAHEVITIDDDDD